MKKLLTIAALALAATLAYGATLTVTGCDGFIVSQSGQDVGVSCQKSGTVTPTPTPTPPPVTVTPGLERFDAAPSDWARWTFWQSSEFTPLQARLVAKYGMTPDQAATRINQQINAWQSTVKLRGYRNPPTSNSYSFFKLVQDGGAATPDVNGAADAYAQLRFPGMVPPPLK